MWSLCIGFVVWFAMMGRVVTAIIEERAFPQQILPCVFEPKSNVVQLCVSQVLCDIVLRQIERNKSRNQGKKEGEDKGGSTKQLNRTPREMGQIKNKFTRDN